MRVSFKYCLSPNTTTEKKLFFVLNRCRELYNAGLQERKDAYRMAGVSRSYYDQAMQLTSIKHDLRPEYQEIGAHVLQDVLRRLDKAFKAFFRRIQNGEEPGYPRFQGRGRYTSFTYPDRAGWKLDGNHLTLTKIGSIRVNTSAICFGCGQVRKKDLSERWHSCDCGAELDRDVNAAINILERGRKGLTQASAGMFRRGTA